jgi:hypothetical protein
LAPAAFEYGSPHVDNAAAASKDYSRAVIIWITQFVSTIIAAALLTFTIIAKTLQFSATGTATRAAINYAELRQEVIIGFVVIGAVEWLFGILLYYFASRSLMESIVGLGTPAQRELLDGARRLILIGAGLQIVGTLSVVYTPLALLGVVPLVLLLLGFSRLVDAYDSWLASPARPGPSTLPR